MYCLMLEIILLAIYDYMVWLYDKIYAYTSHNILKLFLLIIHLPLGFGLFVARKNLAISQTHLRIFPFRSYSQVWLPNSMNSMTEKLWLLRKYLQSCWFIMTKNRKSPRHQPFFLNTNPLNNYCSFQYEFLKFNT